MYRIYIAEDDESIARSVSKGLSGWDFETKCTADFRNIAGEVE